MHSSLLPFALSVVSTSTMFAAGSGLVVMGTVVRWHLTTLLSRAEENAKDGRLSEDQARRRIAIARYGGPTLIIAGMTAFVIVLWS